MRGLIYNKKALTLVEVLVTVSILTLVFGMTFGAMRIYDISTSIGMSKSYLSAQATQALNKMKEELSKSAISQVTVNDNIGPGGSDEVVFQIPLPDLDPVIQEIQWGDGVTTGNQLRYYLGNLTKPNQLIRDMVEAGTQTVLANDITNLQFTLSGNSLRIDITARKDIQRGIIPALSVTMSTQVDFKN